MEFTGMIIDDEKIVREGICDLIDWKAEGYRLMPNGKDGRDWTSGIGGYDYNITNREGEIIWRMDINM